MAITLPFAPFFRPNSSGSLAVGDLETLVRLAAHLRGCCISLSHRSGAPHLGSALSCIDILVAAYCTALRIDPKDAFAADRDVFVLSKGHAATALYGILCARGFFHAELLEYYATHGAALPEQPAPGCAPGIELATGSLGHGLPVILGRALANRIKGLDTRCMVVMGDGECNEGSVWEAAMFASAQGLSAVTAVIDLNGWQATGRSCDIMALADLRAKWEAFGWRALDVDGHDLAALIRVLALPRDPDGRPTAIVARTVKGKGVSFMEDDNNWHYRIPNAVELAKALGELGVAS